MSNTIYVGVDDGHNNTCIYTSTGHKFLMETRAASGIQMKHSITGVSESFFYEVDQDFYTLGDIEKTLNTNFDNYPISTMNRAIVNHALVQAGLGGKDVSITTGLPLRHYYRRNKLNTELIRQKKKNLLSSSNGGRIKPIKGDNKLAEYKLANIMAHSVVSEGIASWIDLALTIQEDGTVVIDQDFSNERVAIVDIGGRTTDIAIIEKASVDQRSITVDHGMLNVHDRIRDLVKENHNADATDDKIYKSVNTNKIKIFGKDVDIGDIVKQAKSDILMNIHNEVEKRLGNGSDLAQVIFVGGGSDVFENELKQWFVHGRIIDDPLYSNARGMMKCALQNINNS